MGLLSAIERMMKFSREIASTFIRSKASFRQLVQTAPSLFGIRTTNRDYVSSTPATIRLRRLNLILRVTYSLTHYVTIGARAMRATFRIYRRKSYCTESQKNR